MDLITQSDDERLTSDAILHGLVPGDLVTESLCAALARAESAEKELAEARGQVCQLRESMVRVITSHERMMREAAEFGVVGKYRPCACDQCKEFRTSLVASSPCAHAERVKELKYQNKQLTEYVEKGVVFRDELQAKIAVLEKVASDAIECAEEGWAYASDYFKDKWKYDEQIAALHASLASVSRHLMEGK